jgi:hypothetical protein
MASLRQLGLSEESLATEVRKAAKHESKIRKDELKYAKENLARAILRLHKLKKGMDEGLI